MLIQSRYVKSPSFLTILAVLILSAYVACADGAFVQLPSEVMMRKILSSVTLPNDYAEYEVSLPVVCLLHGAGYNERGWGVNKKTK